MKNQFPSQALSKNRSSVTVDGNFRAFIKRQRRGLPNGTNSSIKRGYSIESLLETNWNTWLALVDKIDLLSIYLITNQSMCVNDLSESSPSEIVWQILSGFNPNCWVVNNSTFEVNWAIILFCIITQILFCINCKQLTKLRAWTVISDATELHLHGN